MAQDSVAAIAAAARRRTSAVLHYAACIAFAVGSVLFVVGGCFDFFSAFLTDTQVRGSIDEPYFIGSIFYTIGSYAGYLEASSAGVPRGGIAWWRWHPPPQKQRAFYAYLNFTVGALFFNLCMAATVVPLDSAALGGFSVPLLVYAPAVVGSLFFVVGSTAAIAPSGGCLGSVEWHVEAQNVLGSYLFLVAASFGLWGSLIPSSSSASSSPCNDGGGDGAVCSLTFFMMNSDTAHVKIPYVVGSGCFLVASLLDLWLWKRGQLAAESRSRRRQEHEHKQEQRREESSHDGGEGGSGGGGGGGGGAVANYHSTATSEDEDEEGAAAVVVREAAGNAMEATPLRSGDRGAGGAAGLGPSRWATTCDVLFIGMYAFACSAAILELTFVCLTEPAMFGVLDGDDDDDDSGGGGGGGARSASWWSRSWRRLLLSRDVVDGTAVAVLAAGALVLGAVVHGREQQQLRAPFPALLALMRLAVFLFGAIKAIETGSFMAMAASMDDGRRTTKTTIGGEIDHHDAD